MSNTLLFCCKAQVLKQTRNVFQKLALSQSLKVPMHTWVQRNRLLLQKARRRFFGRVNASICMFVWALFQRDGRWYPLMSLNSRAFKRWHRGLQKYSRLGLQSSLHLFVASTYLHIVVRHPSPFSDHCQLVSWIKVESPPTLDENTKPMENLFRLPRQFKSACL